MDSGNGAERPKRKRWIIITISESWVNGWVFVLSKKS